MLGIRKGNAFRHVRPHHRAEAPGMGPAPVPDGAGWEPPVLTTVAVRQEGVGSLVDAIERHAAYLASSGELGRRRRERLERHTRRVVERALHARVWNAEGEAMLREGIIQVAGGATSPYQLAQAILARRGEVVTS